METEDGLTLQRGRESVCCPQRLLDVWSGRLIRLACHGQGMSVLAVFRVDETCFDAVVIKNRSGRLCNIPYYTVLTRRVYDCYAQLLCSIAMLVTSYNHLA